MPNVVANILSSSVVLSFGLGLGFSVFRYAAKAKKQFQVCSPLPFLILGIYVFLSVILLHMPHLKIWPLEWRIYGLNATGWIMRTFLIGLCSIAIALSWRTSRNQVTAIALIGTMGLGGFWGLEHYFMSPIYPALDQSLSPYAVVKQTSDSSCAPAALATVLNQWNIPLSEAEAAKLAHTSRLGTSMPHLIFAAQQLGMEGLELEPSWETMERINRPGILSVWVKNGDRRLPHAVALLGIGHTRAIIADPAIGQAFEISRTALEDMWRHEYVPIFRQTDGSISENQAMKYLAQTVSFKTEGWQNQSSSRQHFAAVIHRFQRQTKGLTPSGKLDQATILALQGPFIQDGPTLSNQLGKTMTMADYHHLES